MATRVATDSQVQALPKRPRTADDWLLPSLIYGRLLRPDSVDRRPPRGTPMPPVEVPSGNSQVFSRVRRAPDGVRPDRPPCWSTEKHGKPKEGTAVR